MRPPPFASRPPLAISVALPAVDGPANVVYPPSAPAWCAPSLTKVASPPVGTASPLDTAPYAVSSVKPAAAPRFVEGMFLIVALPAVGANFVGGEMERYVWPALPASAISLP